MTHLTAQQVALLDQEYAKAKQQQVMLSCLYARCFAAENGSVERAGSLFVDIIMSQNLAADIPSVLGILAVMFGKEYSHG